MFSDKRYYEIINTGVRGQTTEEECEYLREKSIPFSPDPVIMGFAVNDAQTIAPQEQNMKDTTNWKLLLNLNDKNLNTDAYSLLSKTDYDVRPSLGIG